MDTAGVENVTPPDEYAGLVRAAASGDPEAMERLLLRAQASAYRFSLMVCGRADDTEDVMQEALVSTYRHARDIRDPEAFRAWLYRTVRNACLLNRRKRVAEPSHLVSLDDQGHFDDPHVIEPAATDESPEESLDAAERRALLRRAFVSLGQGLFEFLRAWWGDTAVQLAATRARGGRSWAVGTTAVRTLESAVDAEGVVRAGARETNLFIRPPQRLRAVDCVITNFHQPRSTLLMLVASATGFELMMQAYREAVAQEYRFLSYGDAMCIL